MHGTRRILGFLLFIVIALGVVTLAHRYFWLRLVAAPEWSAAITALGTTAISAGAILLVAYPAAERLLPPQLGRIIVWPAFIWMGACFYFLLGLWSSDLLLLITGAHGVEAARSQAVGVATITLALLVLGGWNALRGPVLREVEVRLPRWPKALDGYRITQISDIHINAALRAWFARRIVRMVATTRPDLIAVTGDLVDGNVHHLAADVAPFAELSAPDGVYFVAGNHDHYSGVRGWLRKVEELGMRVLRNTHVVLERSGARWVLAGVDDPTGKRNGGAGDDVSAAISGKPDTLAVVLLAHDPRCFDRAASAGVDLQLSGHTHGGQMWPFGAFVRLQTRFLAGHYTLGSSRLYVSRGTGFWGPPVRIFAPSEVTLLILRSDQ